LIDKKLDTLTFEMYTHFGTSKKERKEKKYILGQ